MQPNAVWLEITLLPSKESEECKLQLTQKKLLTSKDDVFVRAKKLILQMVHFFKGLLTYGLNLKFPRVNLNV